MEAKPKTGKKTRGVIAAIRNLPHRLRYQAARAQNPPTFIVGCGHSGTSILLAVLGAHSHIYAVPNETRLAFDRATQRPSLTPEAKRALRRFDKLAISEGKMRWVEKTPSHIHCMGELLELCPDGKILLIIRDGRDVACSIRDRTGSLEEGIHQWVSENRLGQAFWNHPRVHALKYEQLIQNFQGTMTEVLAFMGEAFEEKLLHHHETPKLFYAKTVEKPADAFGDNHVQYRNWQINQPLFDGRGKWTKLSAGEKDLIKTVAGDMLIEYGYCSDKAW
jgi:hypothetical protein